MGIASHIDPSFLQIAYNILSRFTKKTEILGEQAPRPKKSYTFPTKKIPRISQAFDTIDTLLFTQPLDG
jgi:hypothetical protein